MAEIFSLYLMRVNVLRWILHIYSCGNNSKYIEKTVAVITKNYQKGKI